MTSRRPVADAVVRRLRDRRLLPVFDNCEYSVEPVAALLLGRRARHSTWNRAGNIQHMACVVRCSVHGGG
ncbi:hypothetical protein ACH5AO_10445 [Streptomyces sp. NPDC018964]|uniref:hypothetical protein n=1 Tax=unclassified Streptomyces TaxID=2593676 RepID=UPI003793D19D